MTIQDQIQLIFASDFDLLCFRSELHCKPHVHASFQPHGSLSSQASGSETNQATLQHKIKTESSPTQPVTISISFLSLQRPLAPQGSNSQNPGASTTWNPARVTHSTTRCTILVSLKDVQAAAGQRVCIVGSLPQLGSWDVSEALLLEAVAPGLWSCEVDLAVGVAFEAKVSWRLREGSSATKCKPTVTSKHDHYHAQECGPNNAMVYSQRSGGGLMAPQPTESRYTTYI